MGCVGVPMSHISPTEKGVPLILSRANMELGARIARKAGGTMNRTSLNVIGLLLASGIVGSACGGSGGSSFSDGGSGADGTSPMKDSGIHFGPDAPNLTGDSGGSKKDSGKPAPLCDISCTAAGGTCTAGVCTLTDNPGGVSTTTEGQLMAGGSSDPSFAWLYPYDQTVFPRGLISPTLQFGGATGADAVWVHISFPTMIYNGYFGASNPVQVQLPAASWKAINYAATATSVVAVSVTKISGGMVSGPQKETWTIATGNVRGTIYYETYDSAIITAMGGEGGVGIMEIQPGATTPTALKVGCGNVCHTASADGSTLVANQWYPGYGSPPASSFASSSYNLKTAASTIFQSLNQELTYGGIYPDGSFIISATGYRTWLGGQSLLYSTATGASIASASWTSLGVPDAGTIAFSPDGKFVAFNKGGGAIAMASFTLAGYAFSGLKDLVTSPPTPTLSTLAWPAFTPDDTTIAYHAGSDAEYETDANATGDVYLVDVASGTSVRADALDGYTASGGTYLPDMDTGLSFAPTILPEAVGGYFWVVFTSHRSYGNIMGSKSNGDDNGKLWVSALDINGTPGTDPTHPAFYLDGQEVVADNLRGYWVLSPCQNVGTSCSSGDECCEGFCRAVDGGADECVSPPGGCSMEYEKCTTSSNCCDTSDVCIGGFCSQPPPPK